VRIHTPINWKLIFLAIFWIGLNLESSAQNYYVYVASESEDEVSVVKFDGHQAIVIETIKVGKWPAEIEGPHGITVSPDGQFWYLSMAHGIPYGSVYKFSTETNQILGETQLGLFPATMQISTATGLLYVVNFNLHGDMVPSTVSVVDPETMQEVKRITTGVMPHGSRISKDGLFHYSVAMMSGELFEINAVTLELNRKLKLDEAPKFLQPRPPVPMQEVDGKAMHKPVGKYEHRKMSHSKIKPTWVIPHPTNQKLYIAGNGSNEVLEVDLEKWAVTHRFPGDKGPYNVEITPDGKKMVVTYKSAASTGIWDLINKTELIRIKNSRRVSHGIAISSDNKFAFVSVEGIGGEPGSVDVIDLERLRLIDTAEVGKQAGGIAFWKLTE